MYVGWEFIPLTSLKAEARIFPVRRSAVDEALDDKLVLHKITLLTGMNGPRSE